MIFFAATLADGLPHLAGFALVCIVLTTLWGLTKLLSVSVRHFRWGGSGFPIGEGPTEEEIVVISAALSRLVGPAHRIISIEPASEKDSND